jgi:hypothetical protein
MSLYRGEVSRGDVAEIVGTGPRQARRIVADLIEGGALMPTSSRAALDLSLAHGLVSRFMPDFFPEH